MSLVRHIIKCNINIDKYRSIFEVSLDTWKIRFYVEEAISVAIWNADGCEADVKIKELHVDILTENNELIERISKINLRRGESVKLIERNKATISNLVILIDIIVDEFYATYPRANKLNDLQKSRLDEFDDFEKILNNETFSDVIINVSGKTFHAHKSILSSKSSVFEAMFKQEMKEKKENVVNIDDISPEVFMEMLRFIYVAKVENLDNIADDLLPLADKYDLNGLKNLCGKCMSENLSIDNVFQYIQLATMYSAPVLKEEAVKFIKLNRLNLNTLQNTAMKETLKNADINVVCEIIHALTSP